MKVKNSKVRKFAGGGTDASQSNFKTPSSSPMSAGYSGAKNKNTGSNKTTSNNTTNNINTTTKTSGSFKIPVVGPLTAGFRLIQNLTTPPHPPHPAAASCPLLRTPRPLAQYPHCWHSQ